MPQCKKCGKKGLFLKIKDDTGICLACNEAFAKSGKVLAGKIMEAKNSIGTADSALTVKLCQTIEEYGAQLIELHEEYKLQPSQEFLDLIQTYKEMRQRVLKLVGP